VPLFFGHFQWNLKVESLEILNMGEDAELLKIYAPSDELNEGSVLREAIVKKVKKLERLGLAAVRVCDRSAKKGRPEYSQVVIQVLAGSSVINQVQRFVEPFGSSVRMTRKLIAGLCF
jgi:hypothetical protein